MIRLLRVQRLAATHADLSDQPVPHLAATLAEPAAMPLQPVLLLAAMVAVLLLAAVLQPLLAVLRLLRIAVLLLAAAPASATASAAC